MAVRVEITQSAAEDLPSYVRSGNLNSFVKKLLRLEEVGVDAGQPLRGNLTGWRKIVVEDRNRRILFAMNADQTVATVWSAVIVTTPSATKSRSVVWPIRLPIWLQQRAWRP